MALIIFESTSTAFAREIENSIKSSNSSPDRIPLQNDVLAFGIYQNWIDPSLTLLNLLRTIYIIILKKFSIILSRPIQNRKELAKTIFFTFSLKQNETAFPFDDPAKLIMDTSTKQTQSVPINLSKFPFLHGRPHQPISNNVIIVIQVNQPSLTTIASHMVNNSENSQRQRVNDPRRNVERSADHERGNARQIRGFRAFGSSPGLGIPPLPSREAAQMAEQLFSRSSSPHGRTATIHSVDEAHAASPLAAGDAGAALGRGHRHPPLSRTASSIPLSSLPPPALALPCYRVCDPARASFGAWPASKVLFNQPTFFFLSKVNYFSS